MKLLHWPIVVLVLSIAFPAGTTAQTSPSPASQGSETEVPGSSHDISGILKSINGSGSLLTLETRAGRVIQVDTMAAVQNHRINLPPVEHPVEVRGTYDAQGVLLADVVLRQKENSGTWPADH